MINPFLIASGPEAPEQIKKEPPADPEFK